MNVHEIVSQDRWLDARRSLLAKEKQLTALHDQIARERRQLPWAPVQKPYVFDTPGGKAELVDLFGPHRQLLIYHFMFGPDWKEGCPSCSMIGDSLSGVVTHLAARDVSLVVVSRAPLDKITAFQQRMGWRFRWVSSHGSDFNFDFHVSFKPEQKRDGKVDYNYTRQPFPSDEAPGASVFAKDDAGQVFHTYSTYGRGLEAFLGVYPLLDLVPKGRDEEQLSFPMAWVRYHDRYEHGGFADADKPYWPKVAAAAKPAEPRTACGCATTTGAAS